MYDLNDRTREKIKSIGIPTRNLHSWSFLYHLDKRAHPCHKWWGVKVELFWAETSRGCPGHKCTQNWRRCSTIIPNFFTESTADLSFRGWSFSFKMRKPRYGTGKAHISVPPNYFGSSWIKTRVWAKNPAATEIAKKGVLQPSWSSTFDPMDYRKFKILSEPSLTILSNSTCRWSQCCAEICCCCGGGCCYCQ